MPVDVGTVLAMERWRLTSQPTRAGQQHQIQDLLKCPIPKTTRKAHGVRTSSPATNGIAAFAVTVSCTRRWYANTVPMSTTRPCRRACTSTSTARFGSERNSHEASSLRGQNLLRGGRNGDRRPLRFGAPFCRNSAAEQRDELAAPYVENGASL
jgi:hypothetical protein